LSVTFVYCIETSKHIVNFLPSGRRTLLVFPCQTLWQYADGVDSPNGGVKCKWVMRKAQFSTSVSYYLENDKDTDGYSGRLIGSRVD